MQLYYSLDSTGEGEIICEISDRCSHHPKDTLNAGSQVSGS